MPLSLPFASRTQTSPKKKKRLNEHRINNDCSNHKYTNKINHFGESNCMNIHMYVRICMYHSKHLIIISLILKRNYFLPISFRSHSLFDRFTIICNRLWTPKGNAATTHQHPFSCFHSPPSTLNIISHLANIHKLTSIAVRKQHKYNGTKLNNPAAAQQSES